MVINEKEYTIKPLNKEKFAYYGLLIKDWAKKKANPLADFLEKVKSFSNSDKEIAMRAFMASPGWNDPTQVEIKTMQASLEGVILLLHLVADISWEEAASIVNKDNCVQIYKDVCNGEKPPSDEQILAFNKRMREAIIE